jgi:hypothetical protein
LKATNLEKEAFGGIGRNKGIGEKERRRKAQQKWQKHKGKSRRKLMKANGKREKAKKCKWANQRCQWQHQGMQRGSASQFCGRKQLKIEEDQMMMKKRGSIEKEGKPPHPNRNEGILEWTFLEDIGLGEEERMRNAKRRGGEG